MHFHLSAMVSYACTACGLWPVKGICVVYKHFYVLAVLKVLISSSLQLTLADVHLVIILICVLINMYHSIAWWNYG